MAQKSFNEKPCRRESGDERMSRTKCFDEKQQRLRRVIGKLPVAYKLPEVAAEDSTEFRYHERRASRCFYESINQAGQHFDDFFSIDKLCVIIYLFFFILMFLLSL